MIDRGQPLARQGGPVPTEQGVVAELVFGDVQAGPGDAAVFHGELGAIEDGFDIEEDFTLVATAAKKLGRGEFFKHLNKIFSTFAHPTAIAVIQHDTDIAQLLSDNYHKLGVQLGEISLRLIAQWREQQAAEASAPKSRT